MLGRSNISTQTKDATLADSQADEGQDEARDKYQRSFWEPVAEGEVRKWCA
jgi:hypothetical protein